MTEKAEHIKELERVFALASEATGKESEFYKKHKRVIDAYNDLYEKKSGLFSALSGLVKIIGAQDKIGVDFEAEDKFLLFKVTSAKNGQEPRITFEDKTDIDG